MRLVICLYEQAIEDLRLAILALERGDIEARTRFINHSLTVIAQLQGSLDMEHGGDVAINLARFYGLVRTGLVEAQVRQSARMIEDQISQLATVHEAWLEVERIATAPGSQPYHSPQGPALNSASQTSSADWNA